MSETPIDQDFGFSITTEDGDIKFDLNASQTKDFSVQLMSGGEYLINPNGHKLVIRVGLDGTVVIDSEVKG